jgi:superfamily II DNA helicase RecQ
MVTTSPEILMRNRGPFEALWAKKEFTQKILALIIDEVHCCSEWGVFRPDYRQLGRIRLMFNNPDTIPVYGASASLTPPLLQDIKNLLRLRPSMTDYLFRSNDRPAIHLSSRFMQYPANSFLDLAFLIPEDCESPVPPFLVFFDNIAEAQEACLTLRQMVPREHRHKLRWFHSLMSPRYREIELKKIKAGEVWGYFATDSFGMV